MFRKTCQQCARFARNNPLYLLCSAIYILIPCWIFHWKWQGFLAFGLLTMVSFWVAFSPFAEWILRFLNQMRRLETFREKEQLRPLFEEVYAVSKSKNADLPTIDVYIIDSRTVNACAVGQHSIAVTKGALQSFSEEEIKAILAHEIAHIANHDTAATLVLMVGNGVFSLAFIPIAGVFVLLDLILTRGLLFGVLCAVFYAISFPMRILMAIDDRKAEPRADENALILGYGEDMVRSLYLLEQMRLGCAESLADKLLSTHPRVTKRIENLEILLGIQADERKRRRWVEQDEDGFILAELLPNGLKIGIFSGGKVADVQIHRTNNWSDFPAILFDRFETARKVVIAVPCRDFEKENILKSCILETFETAEVLIIQQREARALALLALPQKPKLPALHLHIGTGIEIGILDENGLVDQDLIRFYHSERDTLNRVANLRGRACARELGTAMLELANRAKTFSISGDLGDFRVFRSEIRGVFRRTRRNMPCVKIRTEDDLVLMGLTELLKQKYKADRKRER